MEESAGNCIIMIRQRRQDFPVSFVVGRNGRDGGRVYFYWVNSNVNGRRGNEFSSRSQGHPMQCIIQMQPVPTFCCLVTDADHDCASSFLSPFACCSCLLLPIKPVDSLISTRKRHDKEKARKAQMHTGFIREIPKSVSGISTHAVGRVARLVPVPPPLSHKEPAVGNEWAVWL